MRFICCMLVGFLGSVWNSVLAQPTSAEKPLPISSEPTTSTVTESATSPLPSQTENLLAPPSSNPYSGDLFTRRYLTGDWNGRRSQLAERGVTMDFFASQFYQGVTSGGLSREFEYGGKLDYLLNLDGQKLGLWQGLSMNAHVETRYGTNTNPNSGTLLPTNSSMVFPFTSEQTGVWLTALRLNQALSQNFLVFAGKLNGIDSYALRYTPGVDSNLPGLGGFQNMGLVFNAIASRGVPYSGAGAGAVYLFGEGSSLGFSVLDPEERSDRGLDNLFRTGVTMAGDLVLRGKPFGLPNIVNLGGVYTTADFTSLDRSVYLDLLRIGQLQAALGNGNLPRESGSWALYASGYQSLWQSDSDPKANWGVFGGVGLADGNPNPIRYYASVGVGGRSMLSCRPLDSFGLGYFYLGLSDQVKELTRNVRPLRDEYGVELFYNVAVTPWCRLTPNFQVVRPSSTGVDTVLIGGLRLQLIF
jgi:porin